MTLDQYTLIREGLRDKNRFYCNMFFELSLKDKREYIDIAILRLRGEHEVVSVPIKPGFMSRGSGDCILHLMFDYMRMMTIWVPVINIYPLSAKIRNHPIVISAHNRKRLVRTANSATNDGSARKRSVRKWDIGSSLMWGHLHTYPPRARAMRHKTKLSRLMNAMINKFNVCQVRSKPTIQELNEYTFIQCKRFLYKLL